MLKIKSIKFSNIGRFLEEQEINFESLGNLIQIDAVNNNTNGSSGSGKSTIFQAILWLLGLDSSATVVLQSRLTNNHIVVEGNFDWNGKSVWIKRNRKLTIEIDGVDFSGSSKIVEEKLDEILGLERHLFSKILCRKQGQSGFFLEMSPSQMNQFLTDCLNLNQIKSKIDTIDQKTIKDLNNEKIQVKSNLQSIEASLKATQDAVGTLGKEPITGITEEYLDALSKNATEAKSALEAASAIHNAEKQALELKRPKIVNTPYDKSSLAQLESEEKLINSQITEILNKEKDRQNKVNQDISYLTLAYNNKIAALKLNSSNESASVKNHILKLNSKVQLGNSSKEEALKISWKIKKIKSGVCHTCEQGWITEKSKEEERALFNELEVHKINIQESMLASQELEKEKTELIAINNRLADSIDQLTSVYNTQLNDLKEQIKPQIPSELSELSKKLDDIIEKKKEEWKKEDEYVTRQNIENQKLLQVYFQEQKEISEKHENEKSVLNLRLREETQRYEKTLGEFKTWLRLSEDYKRNLKALKNKENEYIQKVVDITQKLIVIEQNILLAEEAKRCLKLYLSCSFDDALESISQDATRILRNIPNMANATVRLVAQRETAKGAIKEEINAVIDADGELEVPIKSLSGGERSSLDLAIDMAVCNLIQEKSNVGCDLMALDEVFGGLDSQCIEQALEILKQQNKRILLVEHNGVAKEYVSQKITVIRDGETSKIA